MTENTVVLPPSVRDFRPRCPGCHPDTILDGRPCSYYDCPGLPAELHVTCDQCLYDFSAAEGQIKCDHATCPTAARLRANVPVYRAWVAMLREEQAAADHD